MMNISNYCLTYLGLQITQVKLKNGLLKNEQINYKTFFNFLKNEN